MIFIIGIVVGFVIGFLVGSYKYINGPKGNDMNPENLWVQIMSIYLIRHAPTYANTCGKMVKNYDSYSILPFNRNVVIDGLIGNGIIPTRT